MKEFKSGNATVKVRFFSDRGPELRDAQALPGERTGEFESSVSVDGKKVGTYHLGRARYDTLTDKPLADSDYMDAAKSALRDAESEGASAYLDREGNPVLEGTPEYVAAEQESRGALGFKAWVAASGLVYDEMSDYVGRVAKARHGEDPTEAGARRWAESRARNVNPRLGGTAEGADREAETRRCGNGVEGVLASMVQAGKFDAQVGDVNGPAKRSIALVINVSPNAEGVKHATFTEEAGGATDYQSFRTPEEARASFDRLAEEIQEEEEAEVEEERHPGKFEGSGKTGERLYEIANDGGTTEEVGESATTGWYGLILDSGVPGAKHAILSEDSQGFVDFEPFDTAEAARAKFDEIAKDIAKEEGDEESEEGEEDDREGEELEEYYGRSQSDGSRIAIGEAAHNLQYFWSGQGDPLYSIATQFSDRTRPSTVDLNWGLRNLDRSRSNDLDDEDREKLEDLISVFRDLLGLGEEERHEAPIAEAEEEDDEEEERFVYHVDLDERGEFRAHVDSPDGEEVFQVAVNDENPNELEDIGMRHGRDVDGLRAHLVEMGIMEAAAILALG